MYLNVCGNRYVLEEEAALSWLTFEAAANERRCCLPANHLLLANTVAALDALRELS